MKVLILALMIAVTFAAHHHGPDPSEFADVLKDIEKSKEYLMMSPDDQKLFQDLIIASQKGSTELNAFITAKTFDKILGLTDHLDEDDIPKFEEMLAYFADPTVFNPIVGGLPHKRQVVSNMDLHEWMQEMHTIYKIEDDLHKEDRAIFMQMMFHLEHGTLTQYIDQVGYAQVLMVLSRIDEDYEHQIDHMIMTHLEKEAATGMGPQGSTVGMMGTTTGMPIITV